MSKVIDVKNSVRTSRIRKPCPAYPWCLSGDCLALIGPKQFRKNHPFNCLLRTIPALAILPCWVWGPLCSQGKVGILFQENLTEQKMKVKELLDFQKAIYPNPLTDQQIDDLLRFSDQQKDQFAEKLSGGQRRLFGLCAGFLIGQPDIIFLG